jgi:hypothetical protein
MKAAQRGTQAIAGPCLRSQRYVPTSMFASAPDAALLYSGYRAEIAPKNGRKRL